MNPQTELLTSDSPFYGYSYSYPHKSAYRQLDPPVALCDAWRDEDCGSLFLYLHVPFCEYRCGFCNLFTLANADTGMPARYLQQLHRQAQVVRETLFQPTFARVAIGGGTPTFLDEPQLVSLLDSAEQVMGAALQEVSVSCEASPATVTLVKLKLLRSRGVDRLSLGVQTFDDSVSHRLGRPQRVEETKRAIDMVQAVGFPILNLDLIYGDREQSVDHWIETVRVAIDFHPEEIYLYPLYVRELTGLGKTHVEPSNHRLEAYQTARQVLLEAGYEQVSLRMFRAKSVPADTGPVYCCQADGMVGLGCGARSYTKELHYSTEFAVNRTGVRSILVDYLNRDDQSFARADYGFRLDREEQQRRFAIQGLLQVPGLNAKDYQQRFGTELLNDLPQLHDLCDFGLAILCGEQLQLTEAGIERSDAIGPWLYSASVRNLTEEQECR